MEVPAHWELKRLGHYFAERREKVSDTDYPPLSVTKNGIVPQLETAAKTDDNDNRKRVCAGDFVINSRSDRNGSSGLSELDGSVSLINTVLHPHERVHGRFVHHLLRSQPFQEEFYRVGKGIVADLWSTSYSEMRNIRLAMPPLTEQRSLAAFLDHETARMDALIGEQQRLIALLREKRQARISHAVTKGLNPGASMKGSSVGALGDVPQHWRIVPVGSLCSRIASGKTPLGGAENYVADGVLFLRSQNVYDEGLRLDEVVYISAETDAELAASRVLPGDLLLNITGASLGRSALVPEFFPSANVNQHVCVLRLTDPELREFVSMVFKSAAMKVQFATVQKGAAREGLNFQQIARFQLALPPSHEQQHILGQLKGEIAAIDALVDQTERAIALLQERSAGLVSAAVTGKIDVRARADEAAA